MGAWDDQRTCVTCGSAFALTDYGHVGAQSLAERVDRGEDVGEVALLTTCPECKGQPRAGSAEAARAAVAMGGWAGSEERSSKARFAMVFGALLLAGGAAGFLMFGSEDAARLSGSPESQGADKLVFGIIGALGLGSLLTGIRLRNSG